MATIPLDGKALNNDQATVILYHDGLDNPGDVLHTYIDGNHVGIIKGIKPLKLAVKPGQHVVNTQMGIIIDLKTVYTFEAGKVYFLHHFFDNSKPFVMFSTFEQVESIQSYQTQ